MHHGLNAHFWLVFLGPVLADIDVLFHHVETGLDKLLQISIFFHQSVHVFRLNFTVSPLVLMDLLVENFTHGLVVCLNLICVVEGNLEVAQEVLDQLSVSVFVWSLGIPIEHGFCEFAVDRLLEADVVEVFQAIKHF